MNTLRANFTVVALFAPFVFCVTTNMQAVDPSGTMNNLSPLLGTENKEWTVHRAE